MKVTEIDVADKDSCDPHGHSISKGERYFEDFYLTLFRSKNINFEKFKVLPTTYVAIEENIELDTHLYDVLIRKASC